MEKTYTFFVRGMHCAACELLTKNELEEQPHISCATAHLTTRSVDVVGDFGDREPERIAEELTAILAKNGYQVSTMPQQEQTRWNEFVVALPIAAGFLFLFVLLQKMGIANMVTVTEVTYGTAFFIGIIASLSTCMAVVGGLVLSLSATFARQGDTRKPQALFHAGRIVSFFVLGGVLGSVGAIFSLGVVGTFLLNLAVSVVMLLLGLNLLDVFEFTKRFRISMPHAISRRAFGVTRLNHAATPVLAGMVTFFLPCGFTQSMQIYTLSTGSFVRGGLTMLAFALGTLPVLALVGFSSFNMKGGSRSGIFYKASGLIVLSFGIVTLVNSLVAMGWIPPLFTI